MFRLTDDEMKSLKPDVPNCRQPVFDCEGCSAQCGLTANAQIKKLLLGISKETLKLDETTYLVPDYTKFKEALEEMNDV